MIIEQDKEGQNLGTSKKLELLSETDAKDKIVYEMQCSKIHF